MSATMNSLESVISFLEQQTGLVFSEAHLAQVRQSVRESMANLSASEFIELLKQDKSQVDQLISKVTINETYFFRDSNHFDLISKRLIPDFNQKHGPNSHYKMWSAGCSSGEEAYSLAILMAKIGMLNHSKIFATDIDNAALSKAKAASYSEWSFRNTDSSLRQYFTAANNRSQLRSEIKEKVIFSQLNLAADKYPSFARGLYDLDLILCRNVLIYFDPTTIEKTANSLYESLNDDGVLICGPSDPSLVEYAAFHLNIEAGVSFYTKQKKVKPITIIPSKSVVEKKAEKRVKVTALKPIILAAETASALEAALKQAEVALAKGDYTGAINWTELHCHDLRAFLVNLKATASATGSNSALAKLIKNRSNFILSQELTYLTAILQIDCGMPAEAQASLMKTIYLNPSLAIAHFTLAILQKRNGDSAGAKKSLRNAIDICSNQDKTAILELSDGESAGRILELAKRELVSLDHKG